MKGSDSGVDSMKRVSSLAFLATVIAFAVFCANVVSGSLRAGVYFGDVVEMLTLFAATVFFVTGILAREASDRQRREPID